MDILLTYVQNISKTHAKIYFFVKYSRSSICHYFCFFTLQ